MKSKGVMKLLGRYFISYFMVMVFVMAALLVYAYNSFYDFHSQILLERYQSSLELIRETHEHHLAQLVVVTNQLTASEDVSPVDFGLEAERAPRLIRQLKNAKASADRISGIFLRFYGADFIFSSTSSYQTDTFITKAATFEKLDADEVLTLFEDVKRLTVLPEQGVNGYIFGPPRVTNNVVPIFVPLSYPSGVRCGTVLYFTDRFTYESWFRSLGSGIDLYVMQGDVPLVGACESGVPLEQLLAATNGVQGKPARLTWQGERYRTLLIKGNQFQYDYLMLISDRELDVAMSGSVQMLMLIAVLIAACGMLLIAFIAQMRVKPIKLVYSMLSAQEPSDNVLIEIRNSVEQLINKNAEMSMQMQSVEGLRKSELVRRFLEGDFADTDEWLKLAEETHTNVDTPCFVVAILAKPSDSDYELTTEKVNHLFTENVSGASRSLGMNDKLVLVAFAQDAPTLTEFMDSKLAGLRACCAGITMAASAVHTDRSEGQRAYLEAVDAFEMRFVAGNAHVLRFDTEHEANACDVACSQQVIERLRQALRAGDAERVGSALKDISRVMRDSNHSLFFFRCMYNDILNVVSSEARATGKRGEVHDLYRLSQCLSLEDLDALLHNVCAKLLAGTESADDGVQASRELRAARELIAKRFSEPGLSVSEIAQEVGMTDSRLSIEFKKAYQMTPLEYITSSRMRQACRLLISTDMPIKDIAVECGYYDISGFNRRFKAYTGKTPLKYRQSDDECKS